MKRCAEDFLACLVLMPDFTCKSVQSSPYQKQVCLSAVVTKTVYSNHDREHLVRPQRVRMQKLADSFNAVSPFVHCFLGVNQRTEALDWINKPLLCTHLPADEQLAGNLSSMFCAVFVASYSQNVGIAPSP